LEKDTKVRFKADPGKIGFIAGEIRGKAGKTSWHSIYQERLLRREGFDIS
jgi:hypothetical protein